MQKDNRYTQIQDTQVKEKTGKSSLEWYKILDDFDGINKKSTQSVQYLIDRYKLGKFWARTLYIRYQWERNLRTE